ncbi:beta/alpha barrel domain-containing protein [Streptomyces tendae]|uniref:pyruvate carboxyltransferase n=1 Tax=Streptomyces tendae TaxID=1932 RepID=UPI0036B3987B
MTAQVGAPGVVLKDIAPRLALQAHQVETSVKVELVNRLTAAGMPAIEVSSFVRPDLVPGLADAERVFERIDRSRGTTLHCCVGNARGLQRAIDAGVDSAWFLLSADEEFSRNNTGRGTGEAIDLLERLARIADGTPTTLGTYVIFAWGGPGGPPRGPEAIERFADRLHAIGVSDWLLADSIGYASPLQIRTTIKAALEVNTADHLSVQVHDSRGMGLANLVELVRLGLTHLDVSLGGSGGHPAYEGVAAGGICSEDAVQLLERMEIETGVHLPSLIETATWFADVVGVPSLGFVRRIGPVPGSDAQGGANAGAPTFDWQVEG